MGFDPVTMAATISKLTKSGQIGGETTKAVEVLPPTDVEFAETEGGIIGMISIYAFADNALADIIDNAKTVTVNFDGVDYTSKFLRDEGSGFAMGGNLALAGMGEDTGEPFFFLGTEDDPYNLTVLGIAAGTYTISIYDKTETIKPIDPKYLPKGGVGYDESVTITYDGNGEKVEIIEGLGTMAKISDEPIDVSKLTKIVFSGAGANSIEEIFTPSNWVMQSEMGITFVMNSDGSAALLLNVPEPVPELAAAKGVYVYDTVGAINGVDVHMWVSSVEGGEIHTIDPKYLPPDVLPRVELSEETATTLLGAGVATLNAAEAATLDNMASNATPFLICAKMQGMTLVNGLMQYVLTNDTFSPMYVGILPYNYRNGSSISLEVYNIRKDGDSWTVDTKRVVVTP